MRSKLLLLSALLVLVACNDSGRRTPDSAFYNRGGAEQLLDVSSEVVNLSVAGPRELGELNQWLQRDVPTRAELYCNASDPRCMQARNALSKKGVAVSVVPSGDYTVALVYERVLARDCNPRYLDDSHDWEFKNSPEFGCSVSANIVQHVSNKQQFVNPGVTDVPLSNGAVAAYQNAYKTQVTQQQNQQAYTLQQSVLGQAAQAGGGGGGGQ